MKIYVQKQIQSLYTPNQKKQSMKFNIIKNNGKGGINHIHGQTVDDKGRILKINLKKYRISDFRQHLKNNDSYKLNSNEVYKIYDESKIKSKPKSLKTKSKTMDKKKKLSSKTVDKKKKTSSKKTSKTTSKKIDKKKKSLKTNPKTSDKKVIIKKKSKIYKK